MQTIVAETTKPPAYPFIPSMSKSHPDKSPSLFRFGEGVFTEPGRNPQEQKTRSSQNFSASRKTPQNLVVDARNPTNGSAVQQLSCDRSSARGRSGRGLAP
jgi:hypothetical protein